jgi:hypothetical protein
MRVLGVDFTSAPARRKPITCAWGERDARGALAIERVVACTSFGDFERELAAPCPWVGGFDFPFGLPRELVEHLGWPTDWAGLIRHYAALEREAIRQQFKAFCDARPAGGKFAHRACDRPANSSPSMKWVNPPVAWMLHAGAPRLLDAGVTVAGLHAGDERIALEAYPALVARSIIGNASYKSDAKGKQTDERTERRRDIVAALKASRHAGGMKLRFACGLPEQLIEDAQAELLDAVLAAVQAAWAAQQPNYGLPDALDPVEGWIIGVPQFTAGAGA